MLVPKSALVFLALAWFPSYAVAGDTAKTSGSRVAIEKATNCSDNAAMELSPLTNETAEQVAKAAFEKCRPLWENANKIYFKENAPFSAEDVLKHPELTRDYAEYFAGESELAKKNSIEAWKPIEIDRLRLLVMEARLNRTPTQ
jgi:hypothetical protein